MMKVLLGVVAGVFVGAFVVEIVNRKNPGFLAGVQRRAALAAGDFKTAFGDGFRGKHEPVN